ncbi:hypothetical protein FNL55_12800 [Tardiphaga sp. vice352]|uniref:hypothetical protein n=1 Tax=Tardiphaga sp. vice352 TaxID=2592816 RepID=UPI001162A221|nr:hypothetical protein [Tardiphaga sp. vice352]QDM32118.1 hypothetical protein FNL55_12800 [Tardiphaga sp. vice352]
MVDFVFRVRRTSPKTLSYEAVEDTSGHIVHLSHSAPGHYPDIESYLQSAHALNLDPGVTPTYSLGDSFDQTSQT